MAEIFGAVAAGVSLIKYTLEFAAWCRGASKRCQNLEQFCSADSLQTRLLQAAFDSLAPILELYDKQLEAKLLRKDKETIARILEHIYSLKDLCQDRISRFDSLRKNGSRRNSEMKQIRKELNMIQPALANLQQGLVMVLSAYTHKAKAANMPLELSRRATDPPRRKSAASASSQGSETTGSVAGTTLCRALTSPSSSMTGSSKHPESKTQDSLSARCLVPDLDICSAIDSKNVDEVERLICTGGTKDEVMQRRASALLHACEVRDQKIIESLLTHNPPLDMVNTRGRGVLHLILGDTLYIEEERYDKILKALKPVVKSIEKRTPSLLGDFLEQGDLKERKTPLHYCAVSGNLVAARYLLKKHPILINMTDRNGKTPLHHAYESNQANVVRLLTAKKGTFGELTPSRRRGSSFAEANTILKRSGFLKS